MSETWYLGTWERYGNSWQSVAIALQFKEVMRAAGFDREAAGMATYQSGVKPFTVEMSKVMQLRERG